MKIEISKANICDVLIIDYLYQQDENFVINFTIYGNKNRIQWVTFVHGAVESLSIWFKQNRNFKKKLQFDSVEFAWL